MHYSKILFLWDSFKYFLPVHSGSTVGLTVNLLQSGGASTNTGWHINVYYENSLNCEVKHNGDMWEWDIYVTNINAPFPYIGVMNP